MNTMVSHLRDSYILSRSVLMELTERLYPPYSVVVYDHERFRGMGIVLSYAGVPPAEIRILFQCGIRCVRSDMCDLVPNKSEWPQWLVEELAHVARKKPMPRSHGKQHG